MGGPSDGLQNQFRTAPLADFQIQIRRLADDHIVRPDGLAHLAGADTLEQLLIDHPGNIDLTGKVAVFRKPGGAGHHGGHGALHVRGAPSAEPVAPDLAAEGVEAPALRLPDGHRVDVPVQQNPFSRTAAPQAADDVAAGVKAHGVVAQGLHFLRNELCNGLFVAGIALCLNQPSAQVHCAAVKLLQIRHCTSLRSISATTAAQRGHRPSALALVECIQQRGHFSPAAGRTSICRAG